jgi:Flp pilus assembly protein TadD
MAAAAKDSATEKTAREHHDALVAAVMQQGLALLYEKAQPADAAPLFRRVLRLAPSHYGATYQLAVALDRAGQADEARQAWARVVPLAEASADAPTLAAARERLAKLPAPKPRE